MRNQPPTRPCSSICAHMPAAEGSAAHSGPAYAMRLATMTVKNFSLIMQHPSRRGGSTPCTSFGNVFFSRNQGTRLAYSLVYVAYTHLRAHETRHDLVCRLLLEKKKIY